MSCDMLVISILMANVGTLIRCLERANLSAFRTFVRFVLFRFVGFLFLLGSGKG